LYSSGVPAQLVGIEGSQTYANFEMAMEAFITQTVLPVAKKIRDKINTLSPSFNGDWLDIQYETIPELKESEDAINNRVIAQYQAGIITQNEARQEMGLDPIEGGDTFIGDKTATI